MNSGVLLVSCLAIGKGRFRFATLLTILFMALQLIAVTRFNNSFVSELPPRGVLHDAISAARVAVIVLVTMHLLYTLGGFVVLLKGAFAKQKQTKKRLYPLLLFYWRFLVVVWIAFFVTILVT
jgi:heme/copper-type cytochrome/quinol oxidase subunit 3